MIESAAQVLLSVSNSKTSTDNSFMAKNKERGSSSPFGDIYSQSKSPSQSEKKQALTTAGSNMNKRSENNAEKTADRNTRNENNGNVSNTNVKNTEESNQVKNASADSVSNPTAEDAVSGEKIKQEMTEILSEAELVSTTGVEGDVLGDLSIKEDDDAKLAPLNDENTDGKDNHGLLSIMTEITELDKKYTQLTQTTEMELKPSKENISNSENPEKLSRLQIATAIEKVLTKTSDKDADAKLALAEKIIAQGKLITQEAAISPDKLAAQGKLLKPELALNANASKVLSEQIKLKDINLQTPADLSRALLAEGDDIELAGSVEENTDALLEKILQRLDFNKLKGEENQFAKIAADKSTIAEFVDQLSSKINGESSAGSLLSATSALTAKAGISPLPTQMVMNTNINQPQWGTDFSKRIQFMVNNDIKNAELRLDPPELGRINIKISMNQDQVSVAFSSANGNVRDSIENALPKLREMLQESGLQLSDANVNERQKGDERQTGGDSGLAGPVLPDFDDELEAGIVPKAVIQHSVDGVIDYFA